MSRSSSLISASQINLNLFIWRSPSRWVHALYLNAVSRNNIWSGGHWYVVICLTLFLMHVARVATRDTRVCFGKASLNYSDAHFELIGKVCLGRIIGLTVPMCTCSWFRLGSYMLYKYSSQMVFARVSPRKVYGIINQTIWIFINEGNLQIKMVLTWALVGFHDQFG